MESLYFLFFCLLNAAVIYWALRNDDKEEFERDDVPARGADKDTGTQ